MGRPKLIDEADKIILSAEKARTKLQDNSQRRAIVKRLIDVGGTATLGKLNEHFGFDVRAVVTALVATGWLVVEEKS